MTKATSEHDFELLRVNILNFPPDVQQEEIKAAMVEKGFPEKEIMQLTFKMKGKKPKTTNVKQKITNHVTENTIVGIYFKVRSEQLLQQVIRMVCIPLS